MWYTVDDKLCIQALTYNFLPSWWLRSYGVTFGERMVFDPEYRVEAHRFMERTVHQRFPALHIGSADPPRRGVLPDFGNAITAAAAGCEVVYPQDNYPWSHPLPNVQVKQLKAPDVIENIFPYAEIIAQVEGLRKRLPGIEFPAALNTRGVLNDAMLLGGPDFFAWLAASEPLADKLVDYSASMVERTIDFNYQRWGYQGRTTLANCVVMMVSPGMYANRFLAYDRVVEQRLAGYGASFGVHHCGSFERYADAYRQIPRLNWLEIGWGSDLRLALERFPEADVQYILSAVFVANASRSEVGEAIRTILEATRGHWGRTRLSMPDVDYGTPDENLVAIYEALK